MREGKWTIFTLVEELYEGAEFAGGERIASGIESCRKFLDFLGKVT
jgi:hypothetical protein